MAHLKQAGGIEGRPVGLGVVHLVVHLLEHIPLFLGIVHDRGVYKISPGLDVLDHDLVRRMHREGAGDVFGEGSGYTPHVHLVHFALGAGGVGVDGIGVKQKLQGLVLVDQTVGLAALDDRPHVFFCC